LPVACVNHARVDVHAQVLPERIDHPQPIRRRIEVDSEHNPRALGKTTARIPASFVTVVEILQG